MLPAETIRRLIEERLFGGVLAEGAAAGGAATWTPATGGLSGASVWRVAIGERAFAVRRSRAELDATRSLWITDTLRRAYGSGLTFVAAPIEGRWPLREGDTHLWDAADWKEGVPLPELAADAMAIQAAAEGLARFHWTLRIADDSEAPCRTFFELYGQLVGRQQNATWPIPRSLYDAWPELEAIGQMLPFSVETATRRLRPLCGVATRVQPIHGDARPEHFLMTGGKLTALIDFGAMRRDTVLADVARLAGELALGDEARRDEVVGYYETAAERPIERAAVAALDLAGAVLSAANWLRWLGEKQAGDFDPELVRQRLRAIAARLLA
jgi:hypothetical protein